MTNVLTSQKTLGPAVRHRAAVASLELDRSNETASSTCSRRILIVDDELTVTKMMAKMLRRRGHWVESHTVVDRAIEAAVQGDFDAIISDIYMPTMGGLEMLRVLRERGVECPAVLMTGMPSVTSAASAMPLGVVHYLIKPFSQGDLDEALSVALRRSSVLRKQREAMAYYTKLQSAALEASGESAELEKAIEQAWLAYQPIVSWNGRRVVGFEALVRSDEPLLRTPDKLLAAAERLHMTDQLSRVVRRQAADAAADLPASNRLYVNVHPRDLLDPDLVDAEAPLSRVAHRVVLELTERAALSSIVSDLKSRLDALRELGFSLAIDDLGAGHSSLSMLVELEPSIAKIDMALIRGIADNPDKLKVVRSIVELCRQLGVEVIAEGVETLAECMALVSIGCDLLQGFLFARPSRVFPAVAFGTQ